MSSEIAAYLAEVRQGSPVAFKDTIALIDRHYEYRPTRFYNGLGEDGLVNEPGINEGSCRIFFFGQMHGLTEPETLALFGEYYRDEVLANPGGQGHKNIRIFMRDGWMGIRFDGEALAVRATAEPSN